MTPERWREIERLYHGALEREPGGRAHYLAEACAADESLRREVERLLTREQQAQDFIETTALQIAAQDLASATPELAAGQTVDRYRILAPLGQGGMGTVYTAQDLRLGRTVALKFLLEEFTGDAAAIERFRREARALSALNHPNICTIYDIGESDARTFIAMEYVAGKSLDRLIGRKGVPLNEALKYAVEIADALAKAHAAGIVHRDLKPANVMISDEGRVKLLDFGLAKVTVPIGDESVTGTIDGTIVGTVAYMSPEQAQGKKVDTRSDIFSFGSMLYELITGRRAFAGETNLATLTAILHNEPVPPSQKAEGIPPELERIVARCLRKDPERRFQDAADLRVVLQEIREESETGKPAAAVVSQTQRKSRRVGAIAVLCGIAVVLGAWLLSKSPPKPAPRLVFTRLTSDSGLTTDAAISPDGKLVAYASDRGGAGRLDIFVQQVAGGRPIQLTNNGADNVEPSFSPDSSRIVFRSFRDDGGIYVISALGGEERLVAPPGEWPRFSPDGKFIAYSVGGGLRATRIYIVGSTGGPPRELRTQVSWAMSPVWVPDGKHLLFVGTMDPSRIPFNTFDWWVAPVEGGEAIRTGAFADLERNGLERVLLNTFVGLLAYPKDWAGGNIIFPGKLGDTINLWQVRINPKTWRIDDPPERLTAGTENVWGGSHASDGRLVFATSDVQLDLWTLAIDANRGKVLGKPQQLTQSLGSSNRPSLSADGRKLVYLSSRTGTADIWLRDLTTGKETALTTAPWNKSHPSITADGSKILYATLEEKKTLIQVTSAGKGVAENVCDDCGLPMGWSPDARRLFYYWGSPVRYSSIDVVTRQKADLVHHPKYNIHMVRMSPDGKWLAFHTPLIAEEGRSPIFIAPVRSEEAAGENEWIQVTDGTGVDATPWWSPDGGILYFLSYRDGFQCIWAQRLDRTTRRPAGVPFDFAHFHGSRRIQELGFGPGVSQDLLVFTLGNERGNIWSAKAEARK